MEKDALVQAVRQTPKLSRVKEVPLSIHALCFPVLGGFLATV